MDTRHGQALDRFSDPTRAWFAGAFREPTGIQRLGWQSIASGAHSLLVAPTGSGKTLAAFLWAIDAQIRRAANATSGVRVVYVSPLKALVYDVERNLRAPLVGIRLAAERLGVDIDSLTIDVRTGDTSQHERRRQAKHPGEILVTTPESLFLILGSRAGAALGTVHTVIVDEVHALAANKRGSHLAVSLERLAERCDADPQRIGLSATVRPTEAACAFLAGDRSVRLVDASSKPRLEVCVTVPVPNMDAVRYSPPKPDKGGSLLGELFAAQAPAPRPERGIWTALYPEILQTIREARSTIVFVNNRGLCERLAQRLNDLAGEMLVRAHHGSVSHDQRKEIEEGLKAGGIRGIVATSSLELGIDMGAVDQVLLVESPGSVSRGLQRVGRAGHGVGEVSKGRIYPKFKGDLLESAVVAKGMLDGHIEPIRVPRNPLDVLAQQVVAICCDAPRAVAEIGRLIRRAAPYRELPEEALTSVLQMLTGHYPSGDFAALRPALSWDRSNDLLQARRGAPMLSRMNAGTIADRGGYAVHLGTDGPRIGELDEEMVFETRTGDTILLGASTWRVEEITRDRVIVTPAPGEPGRLPFWRGDGPGRPIELGEALGAFVRTVGNLSKESAVEHLRRNTPLDSMAARNLAEYICEQRAHTGTLPTDRSITIERFRDELGDWRICVLSPFGSRVHAPWAMAIQNRLAERAGFEFQVTYSDDGIVLRLADTDEELPLEDMIPDPDDVEERVTRQLEGTSLFAGLFRENAARALLIPRRRPNQRNPLWAQRLKAQQLLATVKQYPNFPIVLETYRQCMSDVFDLPALRSLLLRIRSREVRVDEVETSAPSPFARSLVFAYVAAYMYEQDTPAAERKAQALTLDRAILAELLGQAELRELIDAEVLERVEAELQATAPERRARDIDEAHDLLRRLGDLTGGELEERTTQSPDPWLEQLTRQRRATKIRVGGTERWIAAQDAGTFRDAIGAMIPPGLPDECLLAAANPLEELVKRYARVHGPFTTEQLAARFALASRQVLPVLCELERNGGIVRGEIRPGGSTAEWCEAGILKQLKQRTLAKLRHEIAAVSCDAYCRFLVDWHGVGSRASGTDRLLEIVAKLEGLPLPWSTLISTVIPSRIAGFAAEQLDMLCATGRIVWVGHGALGPRDGKVALYRRENVGIWLDGDLETLPTTDDEIKGLLLECLAARGACFLTELEQVVRTTRPNTSGSDIEATVWDLVWTGRITNDTFQPLHSIGRRNPGRGRRARSGNSYAGGRWSLVSQLRAPTAGQTERALAVSRVLLERYGVVSRDAARWEAVSGGFSGPYKVLKTMEDTGKVRRGHFVDGLSGAQFGEAGTIDRLRAAASARARCGETKENTVILSSTDPANPYGALLPWPEYDATGPRPRRAPGTWVVLVDGAVILYVATGGRQILTFGEEDGHPQERLAAAFKALHNLPSGRRRRLLVVERIDGRPVEETPYFEVMKQCGFVRDYRGLTSAAMG